MNRYDIIISVRLDPHGHELVIVFFYFVSKVHHFQSSEVYINIRLKTWGFMVTSIAV